MSGESWKNEKLGCSSGVTKTAENHKTVPGVASLTHVRAHAQTGARTEGSGACTRTRLCCLSLFYLFYFVNASKGFAPPSPALQEFVQLFLLWVTRQLIGLSLELCRECASVDTMYDVNRSCADDSVRELLLKPCHLPACLSLIA